MINALLDGEAITFSRFELPPDHPQAAPHAVIPPTHWNSAPTTCSVRSRRSSGAVGPNGARSNAPLVVRFELTFFGPQRWTQRAGLARRQLPRHIDLTLPRYAAPGDSSAVQTSRFRFSCRLVVGVVR
jgi:hypothetical protein